MSTGEATIDTFKLASGVKTLVQMLAVGLFKNRDPVYPVGWNTNLDSRRAAWVNPRRKGTFYKPFEERRRALGGALQTFGLGTAAWAFAFMSNEQLRQMEDDFYSGVQFGTVTMQMPQTEAGLTRLITVTGYIYRPTLDETMEYTDGVTHGYSNVVFDFGILTAVTS